MGSENIHIVGHGAVTAAGARPSVAAAAARVGLSRLVLAPEDAAEDDEVGAGVNVARLSTLTLETQAARAEAMLELAVAQALRVLPADERGPVPTWLVGAETAGALAAFDRGSAPRLRSGAALFRPAERGGSAALRALEQAAVALARGEAELAIVAGAEARTGDEQVAALAAAE